MIFNLPSKPHCDSHSSLSGRAQFLDSFGSVILQLSLPLENLSFNSLCKYMYVCIHTHIYSVYIYKPQGFLIDSCTV